MAREIIWTRLILETFIREAALTEREEKVMRLHVAEVSRLEIAEYINASVSTVDTIIRRCKRKYDAAQKANPDTLPKRKRSVKETFR